MDDIIAIATVIFVELLAAFAYYLLKSAIAFLKANAVIANGHAYQMIDTVSEIIVIVLLHLLPIALIMSR
jgi:uncharacterized membrane protein YgdD (TMEM256/DUF423 family)